MNIREYRIVKSNSGLTYVMSGEHIYQVCVNRAQAEIWIAGR